MAQPALTILGRPWTATRSSATTSRPPGAATTPARSHEHLRRVADEFERARARGGRPPAALAAGDVEQVRAILEAAERARSELRDDAGREASEHVERVGAAAKELIGALDGAARRARPAARAA